MALERFYLPQPPEGSTVRLPSGEAHHLEHVRRVKIGQEVVLFDGSGMDYVARVASFERSGAVLEIVRTEQSSREPGVAVTVAVSLLKQQGMDLLVDLCTQLGMKRLMPMRTERSVVRVVDDRIERWRRIAIEACKQCGRSVVPEIDPVVEFSQVVESVGEYEFAPIASLRAEETLVKRVPAGCRSALVLIGPEGDFTPDEEAAALAAGAVPVSLGSTVLRAETAAAAALAVIVQSA